MVNIVKKIIGILGGLAIVAISIFMIVIATGKFGYSVYIVSSESMYPKYSTGSFIIGKEVPIEEIQIDDVITFFAGGTKDVVVTHQVIDIKNVEGQINITTKGMNNDVADLQPVTTENLDCKIVFGLNGLGYIFQGMKEPVFVVAVILLLVILLGLPYVDERLNRPK